MRKINDKDSHSCVLDTQICGHSRKLTSCIHRHSVSTAQHDNLILRFTRGGSNIMAATSIVSLFNLDCVDTCQLLGGLRSMNGLHHRKGKPSSQCILKQLTHIGMDSFVALRWFLRMEALYWRMEVVTEQQGVRAGQKDPTQYRQNFPVYTNI